MIVSYFEWIQNKNSETWELEEVDWKLETMIKAAYRNVQTVVQEEGHSTRTSAYIVALRRLGQAYRERGIFP